jgi:hypothetical protein
MHRFGKLVWPMCESTRAGLSLLGRSIRMLLKMFWMLMAGRSFPASTITIFIWLRLPSNSNPLTVGRRPSWMKQRLNLPCALLAKAGCAA